MKRTDEPYRNLDEFIAGRDKALVSGDVEKLRAHLIRAETPGAAEVPARILEISLHKCRVHWRKCPAGLLKESVWWLLDHDLSLMLDTEGAGPLIQSEKRNEREPNEGGASHDRYGEDERNARNDDRGL